MTDEDQTEAQEEEGGVQVESTVVGLHTSLTERLRYSCERAAQLIVDGLEEDLGPDEASKLILNTIATMATGAYVEGQLHAQGLNEESIDMVFHALAMRADAMEKASASKCPGCPACQPPTGPIDPKTAN